MTERKFDLFMGCLGNGITVCNRAVMENGDYKHIAHISPGGNIKFYVDKRYIPTEAMEKIQWEADTMHAAFLAEWNRENEIIRMAKVLDCIPLKMFLAHCRKEITIAECEQYFLENLA